ncbi:hypothetical protein SAICODRAFT_31686 [Saitoella complicata NRRL Y-17804]|uniref:uncharacterized protein n=1 Tax=Saitoella complicata (strain BCRC 22490 / CBS 7301 / JCM 7358 / NBRC 10748 / NRRL Y-17804) TaxID=698492 RepID=UPI00086813D8|nr:uncharacterized protein SAICODRAFT_31686 [Saitoella complicata NRRL Y-17804]ODQ50941.1 hypothetical protein SAICODRAFT_31686 [Saitoella complicata NRRL Y-17804]
MTDEQLNSIAIWLGTGMMVLIVLYHYLSVNAKPVQMPSATKGVKGHVGASQ